MSITQKSTSLSTADNPTARLAAWAIGVFAVIVLLDQILKIWVKTHFWLGEDYKIFSWFHLRFVENNGMAFGMEIGSKLILTLFRLVAVGVLGYIIYRCIKSGRYGKWVIITLSLLTAGAFGNLIDCLFYGEIFNNPYPPETAQFVPWGDGYATFGFGRVVDMFYFPLFSFTWPEWLPLVGGKEFSFFDPVFNLADAAVTVSMGVLLIFYSRWFGHKHEAAQAKHNDPGK